ncbi:MAG TPA: hypothetical protein VGP48_14320 [Stellaceae bacterium]|jgi:hypothetical protein|nr:hypothetical protein [Stellaceae bacterium]
MRNRAAALAALAVAIGAGGGLTEAQTAGPIIGHIDAVRCDDGGCHVSGWACQQGQSAPLDVHVYADDSAYDPTKGTLVVANKANLANEPAVDQACRDPEGRHHRFDVPLPGTALLTFHGHKLYVHGIRVAGAVPNVAVAGSGAAVFPAAPQPRDTPSSYPALAGAYRATAEHPRVFVTRGELTTLAQRSHRAGSFTAKRFAALAAWAKSALAAKLDWDESYAGCDMEIYLRVFSFEPKPAYGNDRSDDDLRRAMNVGPGQAPLHGGGVAAARLALYAALVRAGATAPQGAPSAEAASAIAKRILLAWADRGFRDAGGAFRASEAQYCDLDMAGKPIVTQFGSAVGALTLSRGVIYSVDAQDLLAGMAALSAAEAARLDAFHQHLYDAIRVIHNAEYDRNMAWKYSDEVYNNQFVSHLSGLLAIARLLDDRARFMAVLDGGAGDAAVKLPWAVLFDHVIYGAADRPLLRITPNNTVDPLTSHPAYSTAIVAAGEINDRYRNGNPSQGIGYPMGSLQSLFMQAELLANAGFDAYGYRGTHGQSIEMATQYYACFARSAGFRRTITAANSDTCPDPRQYLGKIVNGVDANVVIGADRFPADAALSALDGAAEESASSGPFSLEPILFGKWRD